MRVKLYKSQGNENDQETSQLRKTCSEKTKQSLPQTPKRRSRVLQKLLETPTSKQSLEKKGILSSKSKQEKMARSLLTSLGKQLNTVKYSGGASSTRRAASKILKDVLVSIDPSPSFDENFE